MKKIIIGIGMCITVLAVAGLYKVLLLDRNKRLQTVRIGDIRFEADIADNPIAQARGLSGRQEMGERQAMLFIFGDAGVRRFWMQGMYFPIDIVWISNGRIAGVAENLPPAGFGEAEIYTSPDGVDSVLEINAGLFKKFGFQTGDLVVIE